MSIGVVVAVVDSQISAVLRTDIVLHLFSGRREVSMCLSTASGVFVVCFPILSYRRISANNGRENRKYHTLYEQTDRFSVVSYTQGLKTEPGAESNDVG